jgi:exo-1,4-beta-D-glucosaminidase
LTVHVAVASPDRPGNIHVTLTNRGTAPALLVRAQWADCDSRTEILPTFWSDNYVSLLPGETVALDATIPADALPACSALLLSGYNVAPLPPTPFGN